jgi:conjugative transfer signal peptidase TraF
MIARAAKFSGYGFCLALFGTVVAGQIWSWETDATYRLNTTPSMQLGFWAVSRHSPTQLTRGETVSVCLPLSIGIPARLRGYVGGGECPGATTPMLKSIAAVPGDTVTMSTEGMAVNGRLLPHSAALQRDDRGRPLPAVPYGTYVVPDTAIWLYAGHDPRSFDSRYYGAIPAHNVMGEAWPLLTMR